MYKHIAKHCRRQACCAYCAGHHDTGDCSTPHDKQYAKCTNCVEENTHIKDPAKKHDERHYAFARECPIRASCLYEVHQRRAHGPQFHAPVARPGMASPGAVNPTADPTPAEVAMERSPRAPTRSAPIPRTRSAPSRSKSTATRKRAAEPDSPKAPAKPTTRSSKKAMRDREDPMDERQSDANVNSLITHEPLPQLSPRTPPSLESANVDAVKKVRRRQSARPAADESSDDELSLTRRDPDYGPTDEAMTTNLEDSSWA
ncbi:hypothetical protein BGW36DRAFT_296747 [Talaromyces proteolyticus]|uniref:Uncharacterized protein n=1 Tax=Talaromyces proteolyticus TaxID=1131652 RepID=A0AAD4KMW0_9EURO|nr:uncharacterized protein BGW36DRAFT_296747 [Talaromyces proteolyticus]KAH8696372.1 hypothetical protein BGW36DRAFT_296747 [Talaromyces proteolyticus]